MRARLGVKVDHVATVRQARKAAYPDPIEAALAAELAGADQITLHLREDRRHILERDVEVARKMVKTELNLQIAPTQDMVTLALKVRPDTATLVPERREELTTESGLDVSSNKDVIDRAIRLLQDGGIRVSLFVDADLDQVRAAHKVDAHAVELNTSRYAEARGFKERTEELVRIRDAAKAASKLGLGVAAGHGLHYGNVIPVARIHDIQEIGVGHAIVARAMITGMERAVKDMLELMREARADLVKAAR